MVEFLLEEENNVPVNQTLSRTSMHADLKTDVLL